MLNLSSTGSPVYKCLSVNETNKTWTAYKGMFSSKSCIFQENEIKTLTYSYIKPEVDVLYNENATIRYNAINCDQRYNDNYCYYEMSSKPENISLHGGQDATFGIGEDGIPKMTTSDFSYYYRNDGVKLNSKNFTIAFWAKNELNEDIEERETSANVWWAFGVPAVNECHWFES